MPSWTLDNDAGAPRVARSRPAKPIVLITANSEVMLKLSRPGRTISNTPMKPTPIASQRLRLTRSPKNSAAPATTTSGVACRMVEAVLSGIRVMARAKLLRAMISQMTRTRIGREKITAGMRDSPRRQVNSMKTSMPPRPNNIRVIPVEVCPAANLNNRSSTANAAIAMTMKILLRILSTHATLIFQVTFTRGPGGQNQARIALQHHPTAGSGSA